MKKYCFIWDLVGIRQVDFISAENEDKAKQIALWLVRFYTGNPWFSDIDSIKLYEMTDKTIYSERYIKKRTGNTLEEELSNNNS